MRHTESMKKSKKIYTIGLLYHFVSMNESYYSDEHATTDAQTDETIQLFSKLIKKNRYRIKILRINPNDLTALKNERVDFIFNLVDSKAMEMYVSKILSRLETPYSGTALDGIRLSNNKVKSKIIFRKNSISTPAFTFIGLKDRITKSKLPSKFPVIIKPAFEHCSLGITTKSIARTYTQFVRIAQKLRRTFKQVLIVEEFIAGEELHVTVLEKGDTTMALPIAQMHQRNKAFNKWNIYGYAEKYDKESKGFKNIHFIAPPQRIPLAIQSAIKKDAIRAFYALKFKDYARFDLRYNSETKQWFFLEGNCNPGFYEELGDAMHSSIRAARMTLESFITTIIENGLPH